MADGCTTHKMSLTRLSQSASDPALAALFAEGWEVVATIVIDSGNDGPVLELLLRPPRKPVATPMPSSLVYAGIAAGSAVGALSGVLSSWLMS